jgi:DNA gyrase/topoisomerase IV subunit A
MFDVIQPGLETSIQDYPGRIGFWNQGFPPSGPMDSWSFRLANLLVGNAEGAASLECVFLGPELEFTADATVAVAASRRGFGLRFNLDPHRELSTRAGRRFAKPAEGDEIVGVVVAAPTDVITVVTAQARALMCRVDELPELANPGRGVTLIKVDGEDAVLAFAVGRKTEKEALIAETDGGKKIPVGPGKYTVTGRGGRGHALGRKMKIARVVLPEPPPLPTLLN